MQEYIILDKLGPEIKIEIYNSKKARNIGIRINHSIAKLVLPNGKGLQRGWLFLLEKEAWIRAKLRDIEKHKESIKSDRIPIWGIEHHLKHIEALQHVVKTENKTIIVYASFGEEQNVLIEFLKAKLLKELHAIAMDYKKTYNLDYKEIKISNAQSKWGSCSSNKTLSFNWRLIFAPLEITKYLVAHEICHIVHMNHSKRFWELVYKLYPDTNIAKLWLRQNGKRLYQYQIAGSRC